MSPASLAFYGAAFVLALAVLIVFHELGHFIAARLCGIKVLRFCVGFGKTLAMVRLGRDRTEWAVAAFPLGGYVKMLDEREGPVAPEEAHRAFNRQSVAKRMAVVVAGPLANLMLAVVIYWTLLMSGVQELRPVLGAPAVGTVAAAAGITAGETVRKVNGQEIQTWQDLRWSVMRLILDRQDIVLETVNDRQEIADRRLPCPAAESAVEEDGLMILGLSLHRPRLAPVIGQVIAGSVAEAAGLQAGDRVLAIAGQPVDDWAAVSGAIRQSPGVALHLGLSRGDDALEVTVVPTAEQDRGRPIGRIGIAVKDPGAAAQALSITMRYGPGPALVKAVAMTWDMAALSLEMIGRMIVGQVSWKNVSGPVTIADYAGQSASLGMAAYIRFIALISISLGVLNLLPIPVLDGGHLMYHFAEIIKGGPLSERAMEIGQQIGLALLGLLMIFALYNDVTRLISG